MKEGDNDAKLAIRRNAESDKEWEFHEYATLAYNLSTLYDDEIFNPFLKDMGVEMPPAMFSFDDLRNRKTLAQFNPDRNPQGLLDEITVNTTHFENKEFKWGKWVYGEVIFHERLHHLQENFLNVHSPNRVSHDRVFVQLGEKWGIHPTPVKGSHWKVADEDKPVGIILKRMGFERPDDVPRDDKKDYFRPNPKKGRSTLTKYTCESCGLNVRIGVQDDPELLHIPCGTVLVKVDGKSHNIYQSK